MKPKLKTVSQAGIKKMSRSLLQRESRTKKMIHNVSAAIMLTMVVLFAQSAFGLSLLSTSLLIAALAGAQAVLTFGFPKYAGNLYAGICICGGGGFGNLKTPTCYDVFKYGVKLFFAPKYKADGTLFTIKASDLVNTQAFWDGLVNAVDPNDRIYPAPPHKNIGGERAAAEYKTYDDATKTKIRDGLRTFSVYYSDLGPEFLAKLEKWGCTEMGFYIIDVERRIIGSGVPATNTTVAELHPIYVDKNTWNPMLVMPKGNEPIAVSLDYDILNTVRDSELSFIAPDDLTPVNLSNLEGLLDVMGEFSAASTTSVTAVLHDDYGSIFDRNPVPGLLIADLDLTNLTTGLPVTILTLTESPDGTYVLTFAAQTSGDEMELSGTKTGLDFAEVKANTFLIP